MRVSLIQMCSQDNMEENIQKAIRYMEECVREGSDIICLSEKFLYWGQDRKVEDINSSNINRFREFAKANKINIILGSVELKVDNSAKSTNTCLVINREGEIIHRYDKIFMYTVDRENFKVDEGECTQKGNSLGLIEIEGIKIGLGICFDLRYPEYFKTLVLNGAEVIFLPSSFRKATGELAWDILTRARAIENQIYFCACNQTGITNQKENCGNTQIVSYDGTVLANIKEEEGIITSDLDIDRLRMFRKELPILKQVEKFN